MAWIVRRLIVLEVLLVLLAILTLWPAQAADVPVKAAAPSDRVSYTPTPWNGFFWGLAIGVGQTKGSASTDATAPETFRLPVERCYGGVCHNSRNQFVDLTVPGTPAGYAEDNIVGLLFGGVVGVNKRLNQNFSVGLEAEGFYSLMRGNINAAGGQITHSVPWIFDVAGKVTYIPTSAPNVGLMAKAGLAVLEQKTAIAGLTTNSATKVGLIVGAGPEFVLGDGSMIRIEGDWIHVSDKTDLFPGGQTTQKGDIGLVKAIWSRPF